MEINVWKYQARNSLNGNPFALAAIDDFRGSIKDKNLQELELMLKNRLENSPRQCGKTITNMMMDYELLDFIMIKRKERFLNLIKNEEGKHRYEKAINSIINAIPGKSGFSRNF